MKLSEIRYRITERFFERELDEAFIMGLKEGKRRQASHLRVDLDYKRTRAKELGLTKTQLIGYDRCMEVVKDAIK